MKTNQIITISTLLGILIFLFLLSREKPKESIAASPETQKNERLEAMILAQSKADVPHILEDTELITAEDSTYRLKSVLGSGKLCLLVTHLQCSPCFANSITQISNMINKEDLVILAALRNVKDFKIAVREGTIPRNAYFIQPTSINMTTFMEGETMLFLMDSSLFHSHLFVHERVHPDITAKYIKGIAEKYNFSSTLLFDSLSSQLPGKLSIEQNTINIGRQKKGTHTEMSFSIKNSGQGPLVVIDIVSTCGCTVPEWKRAPILPGDSTSVSLRYNAIDPELFTRESISIQMTPIVHIF